MNKQAGLILFTLFYISAVVLFSAGLIAVIAALIFTVFIFSFLSKNKTVHILALIFIISFLFGTVNTFLRLKYDDELTSYSDTDVTINAVVKSIPSDNIKNKTKFRALVTSVKTKDNAEKKVNAFSFVSITDDDAKIKALKLCDNVELTGRIKIPSGAKNPYQFDYARYLQYKNIFTVFYAEDDWKIISHSDTFSGKFLRKLNDMRSKIISIHAQNIKSPMLEILGGIIFGDDAVNPDEETKKSFINSGIFHILAASGMNVTLIFGIWFFFAIRLRLDYRFSIVTGMLLILFYTCMTGFGPPIIRAYLMLTFILLGKLFDRNTSTISLLFFVALLMLAYNPLMIFDVGFQLSFIVTFSLILTAPLISFNFGYKFVNNALGACLIPFIAQLYAFPLQMYYFNTFTLYSVFANIAIIPVLSMVSFIGFIASLIALIPNIAQKVCYCADIILNPLLVYIVKVAGFFSELPNSILFVKKPSLLQLFLYFALLITITCVIRYKLLSKRVKYGIIFLSLCFIVTFIRLPNNNGEIIFFSVGNADAALIRTETGKYFLFDTGKLPYMSASSQAKNIIVNYIKNKGIKEIEGLVLSHFDSDHAGGTVDVLKNVKVKNVYISDSYEDTKLFSDIDKYMSENNIKPYIISENREIFNENNTIITLLKPKNPELKNENQKSVLMHISLNGKNILSLGDGDIKTYNSVEERYKENISIMKSGHHGAKGTLNDNMTKNTEIFVISTGFNMYGHPSQEVIEMIKKNEKIYYRTDYHNAIKAVFNKNGYKIYLYSPAERKFKKSFCFRG